MSDEAAWKTSDINKLHRFLCFGTEQPAFLTSKDSISEDRLGIVQRLIDDGQGSKVIENIKDFQSNFRSANQKALMYALALCAKCSHEDVKKAAYESLSDVCPTPDELFQFLEYAKKLSLNPTEGVGARGWGKMQRKAINKWYANKNAMALARVVTEYKRRHRWSHLDVLRLAHVKLATAEQSLVIGFVVNSKKALELGCDSLNEEGKQAFKHLQAVESIRNSKDATAVATVIEEHKLPLDTVPTPLRKDKQVWHSLLRAGISVMTLLQSLPVLASLGMLNDENEDTTTVVQKLEDAQTLETERVHPLDILKALQCYKKGQNSKGKLKWTVNNKIVEALSNAHHSSFKPITPTGQRYLIVIDLSEKMTKRDKNNMSPALQATTAAMAMVQSEKDVEVTTFKDKTVTPVGLTKEMKLMEAIELVEKTSKSNCTPLETSAPLTWALQNKKAFDAFVLFTSSPHSSVGPREALLKYRKEMTVFAKFVVCSMVPSRRTVLPVVAEPGDAGMLDISGVNPAALQAIRNLAAGNL